MKKSFRWRRVLAIVIVAFIAMLAVREIRQRLSVSDAIPTSGGMELNVRIDVEPYLQFDPRWKTKELGSSGAQIGLYGCTLCATAMALSSQGFAIDPIELNDRLNEKQGFTEYGLIIWKSVDAVSEEEFQVVIPRRPTHEIIDNQLAKNNPLIAKVLYQNTIFHWVLITGKLGEEYLIHDPLGDGSSHEKMTEYPSGIYALRYLQRR